MGYFAWVLIIVFSICVHEYAHAAMALRMGDDTAARMGHLTLNPLRQMGARSLVMLAILGIAWGSVPVQPRQLSRGSRALVSFSGPGSNALLCALCSFAASAVYFFTRTIEGAGSVLLLAASANGVLFILNMLPMPGLDGWTILSGLFPRLERVRLSPAVTLVLFLLLIGSPLLLLIWDEGFQLAAFLYDICVRLIFGVR